MSAAASGSQQASSGSRAVDRRGLHQAAVESLGRRIVSGELAVGAALPNEADLGDELQVSRTVVREAVKVLAAKGLVTTRPRTGTRVLPREHWDIIDHDVLDWIVLAGPARAFYEDLFEVRSIIEPQAAELAAARRTDVEADELQALLAGLTAAGDDPVAYTLADLPLHSAILRASRNELLTRLSGTLGVALQAGRAVTTRIPGGPASSIPLHRDLVEAIVAEDRGAARSAMQTIIAHATTDMETVLATDEAT